MSLIQASTPREECGRYMLYVYPEEHKDLTQLAYRLDHGDAEEFQIASYHSKELGEEAFSRLFEILESKYMNIDDIFDDILSEEK